MAPSTFSVLAIGERVSSTRTATMLWLPVPQATTGSPIEQPGPVTEASVEGDVMLTSAVERNDDEENEELDVAGAASHCGAEELRQVLDQKAWSASKETANSGVAGITQDEVALQTERGDVVQETVTAAEQQQTTVPAAVRYTPVTAIALSLAEEAGEERQTDVLEEAEDAPNSGNEAVAVTALESIKPTAVENQPAEAGKADVTPIATVDDVAEVSVATLP